MLDADHKIDYTFSISPIFFEDRHNSIFFCLIQNVEFIFYAPIYLLLDFFFNGPTNPVPVPFQYSFVVFYLLDVMSSELIFRLEFKCNGTQIMNIENSHASPFY